MDDKQQRGVSHIGKWMISLAWVGALALLTVLFTNVLDYKRNPNQNVSTRFDGQAKEVVLQSSRFGHYIVTGKINDTPVEFLVDTGASFVSVPEKIAKRLRLKKGLAYRTQTAAGSVTVYETQLEQVSIGDITLYDVKASINPHNNDDEILLGMSFLRRLEVTHKDGQLTIRQ